MHAASCRGEVLNIVGSSAVNLPVADAAQMLRADMGMEIHINTNGGSNAGIGALGDGVAQIAMTTRPLTPEDRADSPEVNFKQIFFGQDVVAIGVSKDVWEGGVHGLTRSQLRAMYDGKITNWKQLGGPDQPIVFFNATEGRGVWELYIQWLYGDSKRAPLGHFPMMNSNEEARNSIEFTRGSMSLLSPKYIDGKSMYALALEGDDGKGYYPVMPNIIAGKYPLMKPMYFVVNEKPTGEAKVLIDFMFDSRGRTLMAKCGYYTFDELKVAAPDFQPPK
jgi:phosphate transport system substrate-binding protein